MILNPNISVRQAIYIQSHSKKLLDIKTGIIPALIDRKAVKMRNFMLVIFIY